MSNKHKEYLIKKLESKLIKLNNGIEPWFYDGTYAQYDELKRLINEGVIINNTKIEISPFAINQACHCISAYLAMNDNTLTLYTGYSLYSDGWYYHSWCVNNDGVIIEATPIEREIYFGIPFYNEDRIKFINEEKSNMIFHNLIPRNINV